MVPSSAKPDGRRSALWFLCFLAAFHPNCSRCCPSGELNCSCKYAWEPCPQSSGCSGCAGGATPTTTVGFEAGTQSSDPVAVNPSVVADPPGGTIAFVPSATGAFVVSSIPAADAVHVVHLEATAWDEDPLTIRTIGDVALSHGDMPGRIVASPSGAHVVLRRGGAIVAIDPATAKVTDRTRVCAEPHGLVHDASSDLLHVACASGEIITLSSGNHEVKHVFVNAGLEDIALGRDTLVATTRTRIIRIASDGTLDAHEARGTIGALRTTSGDVALAFTDDNASFGTVTSEGTVGPFMAVRPTAHATSDLDVASDSTIAIVSDGDAFVLVRGAPSFEPMNAPGIARAVAIGDITTAGLKRRVIVVQTDAPRGLVFFGAGNAMLGFEPM